MRTVYVVQHPESQHHLDGVVGGWFDAPLTEAGIQAAQSIARTLREQIPEDVAPDLFSSDLRRCAQVADAISESFAVPPILDQRLREKSYGEAEGKPQSWLRDRFIPPPATGDRLHHDEGIPGAETMHTFGARVYAATNSILHHDSAYQIIVTHGGAITFILAAWANLPLDALAYARFQATPGSITELHEDPYFHNRQIRTLGSTTHLPR
ncbi:histidine phosphatase family protein [Nocardia brasiliensis]|uniref:histidine phosphatase family protein n=1 Tax=Nocardia brasiliensis TaxID=37326 RepID=UPI003D92D0C8